MASIVNSAHAGRGRFSSFFGSVTQERLTYHCGTAPVAFTNGCSRGCTKHLIGVGPLPRGTSLRTVIHALEKHPCRPPASQNDRLTRSGSQLGSSSAVGQPTAKRSTHSHSYHRSPGGSPIQSNEVRTCWRKEASRAQSPNRCGSRSLRRRARPFEPQLGPGLCRPAR
jgi:hypothetical protein